LTKVTSASVRTLTISPVCSKDSAYFEKRSNPLHFFPPLFRCLNIIRSNFPFSSNALVAVRIGEAMHSLTSVRYNSGLITLSVTCQSGKLTPLLSNDSFLCGLKNNCVFSLVPPRHRLKVIKIKAESTDKTRYPTIACFEYSRPGKLRTVDYIPIFAFSHFFPFQ